MNHTGRGGWNIAEAGGSVKPDGAASGSMGGRLGEGLHALHFIAVDLDFLQGDRHPGQERHHQQAAEDDDEKLHEGADILAQAGGFDNRGPGSSSAAGRMGLRRPMGQ